MRQTLNDMYMSIHVNHTGIDEYCIVKGYYCNDRSTHEICKYEVND